MQRPFQSIFSSVDKGIVIVGNLSLRSGCGFIDPMHANGGYNGRCRWKTRIPRLAFVRHRVSQSQFISSPAPCFQRSAKMILSFPRSPSHTDLIARHSRRRHGNEWDRSPRDRGGADRMGKSRSFSESERIARLTHCRSTPSRCQIAWSR